MPASRSTVTVQDGDAAPAEIFWAFALTLYAKPGVPAACLALQDGFGADVDMVLFALWAASLGRRLTPACLDAADAAGAVWRRTVIQPVRAARRACRPPPPGAFDHAAADALRAQLLAAELAAERLLLGALQALAPSPGDLDHMLAARDNLACLAARSGIPPGAAPFAVLLAAAA